MTVPSMTSPAFSEVLSFNTFVVPSAATNSMRTLVAAGTVTDFSFEKKSSFPMVTTVVFESGDHLPIECGCAFA
jgi:hypothetical protein